jgi:hypothetical protein
MNPSGPVHFYAALGPSASYSYSKNSSNYPYLYRVTDNGSTRGYWEQELYGSSTTQWGAGVGGAVGVEWFACRWLSLHADYGEIIQYRWGSNSSSQNYPAPTIPGEIPWQTSSSGTTKGWTLTSAAVAFGLNVYL